MKYLLDSSAVIDLIRGNEKVLNEYNRKLIERNKFFICPIIYYEVMRGFKVLNGGKRIETFLKFYQMWDNLQMEDSAMMKAAEIYVKLRKGQTVEDNDIFIAAVAIVNDCTLITANEKHFSRIDELKFENWR
ncbi:MAG: PIN domain-containing protein [Selenomonadaceae bacterium]|nr:PIN domain-containing protein [Selenomonadaceae bacterium]